MNVSEFFAGLREVKGTKDKIAFFDNLDAETLALVREVFEASLTPGISYNFKVVPQPDVWLGLAPLEHGLAQLVALRGPIEGNRDEYMTSLLQQLTEEDARLIEAIVRGVLNTGLKNKSLRAVWDDFPQEHQYNRCSSLNEKTIAKLKFPLFSQTKEDGLFVDFIVATGECVTRASNVIAVLPESLIGELQANFPANVVIQGEILQVDENGDLLDRANANGASNRKEKDTSTSLFRAFDVVKREEWDDLDSKSSKQPYSERFAALTDGASYMTHPQFAVVETVICNSIDEVRNHLIHNLEQGFEGTVVKDSNMLWKNGVNPLMIKCKIKVDIELKCIEAHHGEKDTKHEHGLGSLTLLSSCGKLKVSVGSGFKDAERKDKDSYIGKIIQIEGNSLIQNEKEPEMRSVFLPVFVTIRDDKLTADTLQDAEAKFEAIAFIIDKLFAGIK